MDLNGRERYYEYNDNNEVVYTKEAYSDGTETEYAYTYDGKTIIYDEAGHPLDYMVNMAH